MAIIKVLDEILSNKIAAGEVVERCSSVVKELVENSIDAKSSEIRVELLESGVKEIKVIDNGKGMDASDAVNCFSRHATSKIYDEDDLYHIATLGFRGEALASIASVSKVELITSMGDVGTTVKIAGGKLISVDNSDARVGTIISVRDLFYNTPARLKHLKSLYTELANITEYMNKLALSRPDIRFTLLNDNKVILKTDGSKDVLKVINAIYGLAVTKKMIPISNENSDYKISGYISLPEVHRSNRNSMVTIVNGRIVRNAELNRYINEAYHSYKPDNRYPVILLNISVDTSLVDVNIHPTKMDIKFGKQEVLNQLVYDTIRDKIKGKTLIPHIEEPIKKEEKEKIETFSLNFDIPKDTSSETLFVNDELSSSKKEEILKEDIIKEEETSYITHEDVEDKLPVIYPVGLVHGTYIICQNEIGMYIIDQHAAKERINYELVKKKLANTKKENMPMLIPLTIEYTNNDFITLKQNFSLLEEMNFVIEEFGVNSIIVKAHPLWLGGAYEPVELNEMIKSIIDMVIKKEKQFDLDRFRDHIAATTACKMSIKANTNITTEEMQHLIDDLRNCDNPFNCPHGRPTVIFYTKGDLEKMFKRSGF